MRKYINIVLEAATETNVQMVNRIHGEALAQRNLSLDDFMALDPTNHKVYLNWLVSTYLNQPYDLHNDEIYKSLSLINHGDTFSYKTMDDFLAATEKRRNRGPSDAEQDMLNRRAKSSSLTVPEGWVQIGVDEAIELHQELGEGKTGLSSQALRKHYGEAFFTNTDRTVLATIMGGKLDWQSFDNSHPKRYYPSIRELSNSLGVETMSSMYD